MALILGGRFEIGVSEVMLSGQNDAGQNYNSNSTDCTIQNAVVLAGNASVLKCRQDLNSGKGSMTVGWSSVYASVTEVFYDFRFRFDAYPVTASPINATVLSAGWYTDDSPNFTVFDAFLQITQNGAGADLTGFAGEVLKAGILKDTDYRCQVHVKLYSGGIARYTEIRIDNVTVSALFRTGITASTTVGHIQFGSQTGFQNPGCNVYISDLTVNDTTGSKNNGWPAYTRTWTTLTPSAVGTNLTGVAWTNDWQAIDESPTAADSGTERNQGSVAASEEAWNMTTTTLTNSDPTLIHALYWQRFWQIGTEAAGAGIRMAFLTWDGAKRTGADMKGVRVNAVLATWDGDNKPEQGTCIPQETKPGGGGAWSQTDVNNLECGGQISVAAAGNSIRLESMRTYVIDTPGDVTPTQPDLPNPVHPSLVGIFQGNL